MKEFLLWVTGLVLVIVGFSTVITEPLFWGIVSVIAGFVLIGFAIEGSNK